MPASTTNRQPRQRPLLHRAVPSPAARPRKPHLPGIRSGHGSAAPAEIARRRQRTRWRLRNGPAAPAQRPGSAAGNCPAAEAAGEPSRIV